MVEVGRLISRDRVYARVAVGIYASTGEKGMRGVCISVGIVAVIKIFVLCTRAELRRAGDLYEPFARCFRVVTFL